MKITQDMVTVFNMELNNMGCSFKLELFDNECKNPMCRIVPKSKMFLDSFILNPTKEFFRYLDSWFAEREIELQHNNDGTIFWSKSGWDDLKGENK